MSYFYITFLINGFPFCCTCVGHYFLLLFTSVFTKEQKQNDSAVLGHLECNGWYHITKMFECMGKGVDQKELQINDVLQNIKILWR